MTSTHQETPPAGANFSPTHWSVVLAAAGRAESTHARDALEKLCRIYWLPIYAFVRRQGRNPEDAQDLTQEFFARLLEKNFLADVHRDKGRFRSFLLASVKHFLANEWDKAAAQKRGGGRAPISIDAAMAESAVGFEPADTLTAEKIFERRWALALLDQVLRRLREEYTRDGKENQFEQLKPTLTEASRSVPYAEIAAQLGTSEGAIKVAVFRLRSRYAALLRQQVAATLEKTTDAENELHELLKALA